MRQSIRSSTASSRSNQTAQTQFESVSDKGSSLLLADVFPLLHFGDNLTPLVDHVDVEQRLDLPLPIGLGVQISNLFR